MKSLRPFLRAWLALFSLCVGAALHAADVGDVLWENSLETEEDWAASNGRGERVELPDGNYVLEINKPTTDGAYLRSFQLPVEELRGKWIFLSVDVKAKDVSEKPLDWNGIKAILEIARPEETDWPQIPMPVGTFDWDNKSVRVLIPEDATQIKLHTGLERVTGTVWFDNLQVKLAKAVGDAPAAAKDKPIFKGHAVPALRGAMAHPRISREDVKVFGEDWNGNVLRYQLLHMPKRGDENDLDIYDAWLERELDYLDQVLGWCQQYGVLVVVDLHSPPGGNLGDSGTVNASGPFWSNPEAQEHFIKVWRRITKHYKGTELPIWGFDLLNEPEDRTVVEGCADWQTLADQAAHAVREIDPDRTLIIEPPRSGGPSGFLEFQPIDLPRIVYSFHMYEPLTYTHQGVFGSSGVAYPGEIDGEYWDKAKLEECMQPAIDFAQKYRVQLYIGEFSVTRWAPGAEQYLADVIAIFESHGWDWTYHSYREWHAWNLELGTDEDDQSPTNQPGKRLQVILDYFKKNQKPRE